MFNRELVKGSSSLLILQLLSERDMYGYEIAKEMERRSEASLLFEGTLYPALQKLEQKGLISSYWKAQESGPDRKYYAITPEGRVRLREKTSEWQRFVSVMGKVLGGPADER
jgi:PadR family transcriptional regulator PadR